MLRNYKWADKLWQFEEGEQPADAVLVEVKRPQAETPEVRAAKAPAKRKAASKKEDE